MMNLTSAMPTATRGVFSKNIVIAYRPSVAYGFIVRMINRHLRRVRDDRDSLREVTSLSSLVGITSKYEHLVIVDDIFFSHILEERKKQDCEDKLHIAHKQKVKNGVGEK